MIDYKQFEGHTPGPWSARREGAFDYRIALSHIAETVCKVRCEANACLIAAAPELLAENKKLREALEGIIESAEDGRDCPEWLEERITDARAALNTDAEESNGRN